MSFGFSAGDFVTCLALINDITQALRSSNGSVSDFSSLSQVLQSITQAIAASEVIYMQWSDLPTSATSKASSKAMINGMLFQRQKVMHLISSFLEASRPYTDAFFANNSSRRRGLVRNWKKITWMYQKDEIAKLERDLRGHLDALKIYNDALCMNQMSAHVESMQSKIGTVISSVSNVQADISMLYQAIQMSRQPQRRSLGYSWESSSALSDTVQLLDANGRTLILPMLFLTTPGLFHDILKLAYQGLPGPGSRKIIRREYTITDGDVDGTLIGVPNWNSLIRPGMQISLNMILRAASWKGNCCPKCSEPMLGHVLTGKRTRCHKCQLTFRLFERERIVEEIESADNEAESPTAAPENSSIDKDIASENVNSSRMTKRERKDQDDDLSYFSRVHYHREVLKKQPRQPDALNLPQEAKFYEIHELPPLHRAAAEGDVSEIIKLLDRGEVVDAGLPVNNISGDVCKTFEFQGCSPLHLAIFFGKSHAVDVLLRRGADIHKEDDGKADVLEYAVCGMDHGLVMKLLACGASTRGKNKFGKTSLHYAASSGGDALLFWLLLEYGVDPMARDLEGRMPIHDAALGGNIAFTKALLEYDSWYATVRHDYNETALHDAAWKGHLQVVTLLLDRGADIESAADDKSTPLHDACWYGNLDVATLLLDRGANISARREDGQTPLNDAARRGCVDIVNLLIQRKADVTVRTNRGNTPLYWASSNGHVEVIKVLLAKGADIMAKNEHGETALHAASETGMEKAIELLITSGADPECRDNFGGSALKCAVWEGHEAATRTLLEHGADINGEDSNKLTALSIACCFGHTNIVRLLLDKKADTSSIDSWDQTVLHHAAFYGDLEIVQLILGYGLDLTARRDDGGSPLHCAANSGNPEAILALIDKGANVQALTNIKDTPLGIAAVNGKEKAIQVLLEAGADPWNHNIHGFNAVHLAGRNRHEQVADILLEAMMTSDPSRYLEMEKLVLGEG